MLNPNSHQLKIIADFANYIAVAWFTGGIVTPILTQPGSLIKHLAIPLGSTLMTIIFLWFSLAVAKRAVA